jgi:hypothetical protein
MRIEVVLLLKGLERPLPQLRSTLLLTDDAQFEFVEWMTTTEKNALLETFHLETEFSPPFDVNLA